MTIYDYACDACSLRFEVDHPMSAPAVRVCPECGQHEVRKVLTTGGISIRGGANLSGQSSAPPCATGGCGTGMCGMG